MKLPRILDTEDKVRVEVLPLIDVIFIVLIAFVYAMIHMDVVTTIDINLPVMQASKDSTAKKPLIVSLDSNNILYFEGSSVDKIALIKKLKSSISINESGMSPIIIEGDQSADLGVALALLDDLRKQNITKISFRVKDDKK